MIVHEMEPIALIGGGTLNTGDFDACLALTSYVVAADGGAAVCVNHDVIPNAVIGDMDSVDEETLSRLPPERIHRVLEQDSTDFDKALRNISAPLIIGAGFTGGRMDHELACFNAMLRHADRRCILVGECDIVFLAPPTLTMPLVAGTRVSLFPLSRVAGHSQGLRWPIGGLDFRPDGKIGTSNEAVGPVTLDWDRAGMLVILPRDCLEGAVKALVAQPGSWSAH